MQIRAGLQNHAAERRADFLRSAGVGLVDAPRKDLEALLCPRADFFQKTHGLGRNGLVSAVVQSYHRTDRHHAEDTLQGSDRILVIVGPRHVHIDAAVLLHDIEFAVELFQCKTELTHQRVLEFIAVLALDADLAVFYQKRLILHPLFLTV